MPALIDSVVIGDGAAKAYIEKQLPPQTYTITTQSEKDSSVTIDMLAGQIYYVWQEVKMGMWPPARHCMSSIRKGARPACASQVDPVIDW